MATLHTTFPSLLDMARLKDPDGSAATVAELLKNTNAVLDDMGWREGNTETGNRSTVQTGLPSPIWRMMYKGVQPTKGTTAQVDDVCGMLEGRSEIDKDLAKLNNNDATWRLFENMGMVEAMNQKFATALFYGNNSTNPEQFTGLAPRYSAISGATNASHVISGSGSGSDNTSIWLVVWGPNIYGIYPKGTQAGLLHEDLGEGDAFDGNNNRYRALMERWQWKCGLTVRDWRYAVRICNIDISDLVANSGSQAALQTLMTKALWRVPNLQAGKPVFYCNRTVMEMLDIQRRADVKSGGSLTYEVVDGKWVPMFRGIPIRLCDALTETEATVS